MENHWKRSRIHPEIEVNLTLKRGQVSSVPSSPCRVPAGRSGKSVHLRRCTRRPTGVRWCGQAGPPARPRHRGHGFDGRYRAINSLGSHWDPKNIIAYKSWAPANSRPVRVTLADGQVTEAKSVLEATQILMRTGENISPKRLRELFKTQNSVTLESGTTLFCYSA